jgi:hypothetical protein
MAVLEMKIWINWSESNSWIYYIYIYIYIWVHFVYLNNNWKMYWSEQSFAGLSPEDSGSSWGLKWRFVCVYMYYKPWGNVNENDMPSLLLTDVISFTWYSLSKAGSTLARTDMTSLEPSLPCRSHLFGCSIRKLGAFFMAHVKVGWAPTSTFTCSGVTVSPYMSSDCTKIFKKIM